MGEIFQSLSSAVEGAPHIALAAALAMAVFLIRRRAADRQLRETFTAWAQGRERLGNQIDRGQHRHEIGIAVPAGNGYGFLSSERSVGNGTGGVSAVSARRCSSDIS